MSLSFSNATGNLFNRLGKLFGAFIGVEKYQKTTLPAYTGGIGDQFNANRDYIPTLIPSEQNAQNTAQTVKQNYQTFSTNALVGMIQADTPQPSSTLDYAIPELIDQMNAAGATVKANTVGISGSAGASNAGNGTILTSIVGVDGKHLENAYAETIVVTCTADSQPGNGQTTVGSETFVARGQSATTILNYAWPTGSGGATTVIPANSSLDTSSQNYLTNSDFETFTVANTPDSWTIIMGGAGTTIFSTTDAYRGSYALAFTGTASNLRPRIAQSLRSVSTSVAGQVNPLTKYALAAYVKVTSVPVAGTLRIALRDGTTDGAAVVGGEAIVVNLASATTGYVLSSAIFNTPTSLPDNLYLVIELTIPIDSGVSVHIDDVVLTPMVQHQNGPFIAIIPGSAKFIKGDVFNVAVTNTLDGLFQTYFNRIFGMDYRKLLLPSDMYGTQTISDSLISV